MELVFAGIDEKGKSELWKDEVGGETFIIIRFWQPGMESAIAPDAEIRMRETLSKPLQGMVALAQILGSKMPKNIDH